MTLNASLTLIDIMKILSGLFVFILALLLSCQSVQHKWQFEIKNDCRFPDAYQIRTTFTPTRYRISVIGNLSDKSRLYKNIHSDNSKSMSTGSIELGRGKIDYTESGDIYTDNMTIIYVPGREVNTVGSLKVTVEIH